MGRLLLPLALCILLAPTHAQQPEPAAPDKPLPDIHQLILDVERNQKAAEALRKDYTYHIRSAEKDVDKNGAIKKTEITDSESVTIEGVRVDRVVARDGKPLTADEQKKESDRIDKAVAKGKERRTSNEDKGKDTDSNGNNVLSAARILELGTFSNPRRIDLNGRPTILADYAGDPDAKTHSSFEKVFRDLVGTVWIDEKDRVLVHAQGHFLNDFKVGGGLLADIHGGFNFDVTFANVNGEVWLVHSLHAQGSARFLLFDRIAGSYELTASDYRKFHTTTTIQPTGRMIDPSGNPIPPPDAPQPATPPKPNP